MIRRAAGGRARRPPALILLAAALATALPAAGCTSPPPFLCTDNSGCVSGSAQGICEVNGACSFPDRACPSHQRYGDGAPGGVAGACVPMTSDCIADIVGGGSTEQGQDVGHTCVRRKDGAVLCWGDNSVGQLGGPGSTGGATSADPVQVLFPHGEAITAISSGARFVCALAASGNVYCWGDNGRGQLGIGIGNSDPTLSKVPVRLTKAPAAHGIGAGSAHACLVDSGSERVDCWGENGDLQISKNANDPQPTPYEVPNFEKAVAVGAGARHTCALREDSSVWCWGSNALGQLGRDGTSPLLADAAALPAPVTGLPSATAIALGAEHTCVLLNDSTLFCWGANVSGSVGNGSIDNANAPARVLDGVTGVATSGDASHTCAIRVDETLWCWGNNDAGQVGLDPARQVSSVVPVQVPLPSVKRAGTGAHHSCAVTADGSLWCWGSNHSGQLGGAFRGSGPEPHRVPIACD